MLMLKYSRIYRVDSTEHLSIQHTVHVMCLALDAGFLGYLQAFIIILPILLPAQH
jgi:hypothetical protein